MNESTPSRTTPPQAARNPRRWLDVKRAVETGTAAVIIGCFCETADSIEFFTEDPGVESNGHALERRVRWTIVDSTGLWICSRQLRGTDHSILVREMSGDAS
jgi:hypothetical protein